MGGCDARAGHIWLCWRGHRAGSVAEVSAPQAGLTRGPAGTDTVLVKQKGRPIARAAFPFRLQRRLVAEGADFLFFRLLLWSGGGDATVGPTNGAQRHEATF